MEILMSSASQGMAPREGLELLMLKLGHTKPWMEPRRGTQAGKSGYPRSQNADTTVITPSCSRNSSTTSPLLLDREGEDVIELNVC